MGENRELGVNRANRTRVGVNKRSFMLLGLLYASMGILLIPPNMEYSMDEIVEVYYNLHKKCLSVRHKGKVIYHTPEVTLRNAKFVVREGGRQRVLQEGKKNVHAFVKGEFVSLYALHAPEHARSATYNPYRFDSFVDLETLEPVHEASLVVINGRQITYGA